MKMSPCQFAFAAVTCLLLLFGVNGNASENADETSLDSALAPQISSNVMYTLLLPSSHRHRRGIIVASGALKIGSCPIRRFQYNSAICSRLLYAPYRNVPDLAGETCRSQMPKYFECQKAVYGACVSDPSSIDLFMKTLVSTTTKLNFDSMACDLGGFAKHLPPQIGGMCDSTFNIEYKKCTDEFTLMYTANRGDPKLCPMYTKTVNCLIDAMSNNCHSDIMKATSKLSKDFNTKEMNPFCSMSEGGADENAVMAGKLLDPPASGASLPSISIMAILLFVLASAYLF